ncbi:MBL fold metallo-hydrolase [Paracidobacterium acidisoli]|uniref:MBL fold metallo-hydrolase n=1 Tax=Paracidobacterium acidisoli TaxID=2303751 RepID=A0A372IKQ1_9BACT|nr:MBL fold metallo-hydrolase [Paracidobacterium acidisoli]MBT9332826.1 MBL fold metallo-hydrolase [Paracidobacterium acidisoli]
MVRMTVLASGSRGNSTVVSSSKTRVLVDAGLSCRELMKRMWAAGEDPETLDAIVITHEHQDHVQGLAVTARKLGIPVYFTEPTHRAWMRWMTPRRRITYAEWLAQRQAAAQQNSDLRIPDSGISGPGNPDSGEDLEPEAAAAITAIAAAEEEGVDDAVENPALAAAETADVEEKRDPCALPAVEYFQSGRGFSIGDISITPFTIPHDAVDPVGFVFEANGVRIGFATDLGYMASNVVMHLRRCDVLMLESNHDLEMLRDGPYPWPVKQRVLSRVGHLSNDAAAEFLEKSYDGGAAYVVLAHLSESNNLPELARVAAERALRCRMSLLANQLLLASQDAPMESIRL